MKETLPKRRRWREDEGNLGLGWFHHGFCKICGTPLTEKKHLHDTSVRVTHENGAVTDDAYCVNCFQSQGFSLEE